jgi:DNA polymerase-4
MIVHFDLDAFYASVAQRDDPSLRGVPLAISGSSRRAVVLTASYEARPFGVRSAVPLYKALQACPQLVVVPPNMAKYKEVSREIFEIFELQGNPVEGLSMDEAFIDLGPCDVDEAARRAQTIRDRVLRDVGLTISAGVATGKMVAKILSDSCKPNGLRVLPPGEEAAFLAPLPVGRLWGIGPKTERRLQTYGITTIGAIAAMSLDNLRQFFGSSALEIADLARGIDHRTVDPVRETKSISSEETFEYDVTEERVLIECLREQARELAQKLERESLCARTVGVKIKRNDFRVLGRQTHLAEPTNDARRIFHAAVHCLRRAQLGETPVRLLGTRVASLTEGEPLQQSLFSTGS